MKKTPKFTDKQRKFCQEYLKDLNAAQAAIRAGYKEKTAKEIGYENLTKPHVADYIAQLQAEVRERNNITIDMVVERINDLAIDALEDRDRLKANDMLMKHLGGYNATILSENKEITLKIV